MPTYEYQCSSCNHQFEAFQSIKDEPLKECPLCHQKVNRLISGGAGVIFKGNGYYCTDKNAKKPAPSTGGCGCSGGCCCC